MQNVMGVLFIKDTAELRITSELWSRCMVAGMGFRDAVKAAFATYDLELIDFDGAMAQPTPDQKIHLRVWSKRFRTEQGG